jgi:hypothetical protein
MLLQVTRPHFGRATVISIFHGGLIFCCFVLKISKYASQARFEPMTFFFRRHFTVRVSAHWRLKDQFGRQKGSQARILFRIDFFFQLQNRLKLSTYLYCSLILCLYQRAVYKIGFLACTKSLCLRIGLSQNRQLRSAYRNKLYLPKTFEPSTKVWT